MTDKNIQIKIGQLWRHYKGKHYKILAIGRHSETLEDLICYQRQEDDNVYMRPMDLFFSDVEYEGKVVPRFVLIS